MNSITAEVYAIGDKIVHPMYGAGTVTDIVTYDPYGRGPRYYVFQMPVGTMTVSIPVDSAAQLGVRNICSGAEADALLRRMAAFEISPENNWNRRFKDNALRIKSGDETELFTVLRSLTDREKIKELSMGERKMYRTAVQIFASEIAVAKGMEYREAEDLVYATLGRVRRV